MGKYPVHADTLMKTSLLRASSRGFTLMELMVVLAIVAILVAVGAPNLTEFVATQRVRTAASDMVGEIAFSRAKAIESSRRVVMQRLGTSWDQGWRTFIDADESGTFTAGDTIIKQFDGFGYGSAGATRRFQVCGFPTADFGSQIVLRPDGRVVRGNAAPGTNDGIWVYMLDWTGGNSPCNNITRHISFGLSGRVDNRVVTSGVPACKGVTPPC